jgi:hypothetical protein
MHFWRETFPSTLRDHDWTLMRTTDLL